MARLPTWAAAAALLATIPLGPTAAADDRPSSWSQVKCERYKAAWAHTLAARGSQGLGPDFLTSHQAFLDSGCLAQGAACPRSPQELAIANVMVILAMNAGAASTFLPFHCR